MTNHDLPILGLLTANISVDAIVQVIKACMPVLNALAVLVQIGIGVFTLLYVARKWQVYNKKTEKEVTPEPEAPGQAKKE